MAGSELPLVTIIAQLPWLGHVPLVARIPPLRPVVVCGGLLAVLRDCCWGLSSHTIVEFAKDQSNCLVAGSLRSFPQDSWRSEVQFYQMKRMIRGLRIIGTLTYSQTLN